MRFKISLLLILVAMVASSGYIATAQDEPAVEWVCPEGFEGQVLRLFNWADYVADETIPRFEELCGVQVEYFSYASNEEMVSVLRANSAEYDLVVPSGYTVEILIQEELAQPLNKDLIPNLANVAPAFQNPPYDPESNYSVPYQWGTVIIAYNKEFVEEEITSWADFFAHDGPVVWLDDQRAILGVALDMLGFDPNTTNEEEIMAAADFLLEQNQDADGGTNVREITFINARNLMLQGDVDMASGYSGDMLRLAVDCECEDYGFVIPSEGTNLWTDNLAIPFNAPNPELAHAFIDYILDPVVGAELTDWVAYATPNAQSQPLTDEAARTNPIVYPEQDVLDTMFVTLYAGEAEPFYSQAWTKVLAEIAQ